MAETLDSGYWDALMDDMPPEDEIEDPYIKAMTERDQRKRAIFNELTEIDYVNRTDYWQDVGAYNSFTNYLDAKPIEPPIEDNPDILILF